ncbi:hypothetical protein F4680DRAFT_465468 [Xylaria scruposa]|nr:hypothetical protein F4680DRAFT_465468 [Xylaria scruposa]
MTGAIIDIDIDIGAAIALQDRDRVQVDAITEVDRNRVLPLPIGVEIDVAVRPRLAAGPRHNLLSPGAHDSTESSTRPQCPPVHRPYRLIGVIYSAKDVGDFTATLAFAATTRRTNYRCVSAMVGPLVSSRSAGMEMLISMIGHFPFTAVDKASGPWQPPSLHTRAGDVHLPGTSNDLVLRTSRPQSVAGTRNSVERLPIRHHQNTRTANTSSTEERGQIRHQQPETGIDAHQKAPKVEGGGSQSPTVKTESDSS